MTFLCHRPVRYIMKAMRSMKRLLRIMAYQTDKVPSEVKFLNRRIIGILKSQSLPVMTNMLCKVWPDPMNTPMKT